MLNGALTIEAAIVLPLIMAAFLSILFLAKAYYIQDQIHSALTRTVHDLAVDLYALDASGLVDVQQHVYQEKAQQSKDFKAAVAGVTDNAVGLRRTGEQLVSFGHDLNGWYAQVGDLSLEDVASIAEFGQTAVAFIKQGEHLAEEAGNSVTGMLDAMAMLYQEGMSNPEAGALAEAVEFANGLVADKVAASLFHGYLSEEQLSAWGVSADSGLVDLSMSGLMLYDDTVEVVAVYQIDVPFGHEWFAGALPMFQKASARVWTGSYTAGEIKHHHGIGDDHAGEEIFYISTRDTECYHYYTCLRKPTLVSTYREEVRARGRSVCSFCIKHYPVTWRMPVYCTSRTSKVHLNEHCPKIYSPDIKALTLTAAESLGRRACSNCVNNPDFRE